MLQLQNHSPFNAYIALFPDEKGVDTLYVMIKATFDIGEKIRVSEEQLPFYLADEYWGDPDTSSLKYASELHLTKPGTDVVLVGEACAKDERSSVQLDVMVSVANQSKTVRVFGDRYWSNSAMGMRSTSPMPFTRMPLLFERAFGGVHKVDTEQEEVLYEARNPVGTGFCGKRKKQEIEGMMLPNLEDPGTLITLPHDRPTPAAFGFIAPAWEPRKSLAGTYDDQWQKNRAPYLPLDFSPKFFHSAHPDLTFVNNLQGGEPVLLYNVSPFGPLKFKVPRCKFTVPVRISGNNQSADVSLESLVFEPSKMNFTMLWRGAIPCDKQALNVEQIEILIESMDLF